MQVHITGKVADSAAVPANGRIEFSQAQRFDNGELQVTGTVTVAQVVAGELRTAAGDTFSLPSNPEGTAVRIREVLGGSTFEWWAAVPEEPAVEYRMLPLVESEQVPASVWGPPPWLADVEQMRDQTLAALEEGNQVAESLGGLAGIQQLISDASAEADRSAASAVESAASAASAGTLAGDASASADRAEVEAGKAAAAAGSAAADAAAGVIQETAAQVDLAKAQADRAKAEADRAEAVANSIDMSAINTRLDGVDSTLTEVQTDLAAKASKQYVDDKVAGIVGTSADLVGALKYPLYIAHRGAGAIYPEHSVEAYRESFRNGFTPEADVRRLSDGTLVCHHDVTTNRTMTISKAVSACTRNEWLTSQVKPPQSGTTIFGSAYGTPAFFEDYLDEYGGRVVLWPEIKDFTAADQIIKAVTDRGLQRSVVIQAGDVAVCKKIVAAGCHALLLTNQYAAASAKADGIEFVGVSGTATNAYITSMVNVGIKVISYTQNTKVAADEMLAKGCSGVFSDDPWEASGLHRPATTLDLSDGYCIPGLRHSKGRPDLDYWDLNQVIKIENDSILYDQAMGPGRSNTVKLPQFGFTLGATKTVIRFWVESCGTRQTGAPEEAWLFGVYIGAQTGGDAVNEKVGESTFKLAMIRRNGQKNLYEKRTSTGATTRLAQIAAPSTPYSKPGGRSAPMQFEVEITPTSIAVRNLTLNDTDAEATTTSLIIPGAYLTLGTSGSSSRFWDVSVMNS